MFDEIKTKKMVDVLNKLNIENALVVLGPRCQTGHEA
jgi:hypothetical protein